MYTNSHHKQAQKNQPITGGFLPAGSQGTKANASFFFEFTGLFEYPLENHYFLSPCEMEKATRRWRIHEHA